MSEISGIGAEPAPTSAPQGGKDSAEDQRYFQAIEESFIRLRGAPFLLSPADWRTAQEWRRLGIPLSLVDETLEEIFRRRQERGAKNMVSSLRYCKRAVESAWEEARELTATAQRAAAEALELGPLLAALAAALPADLPGRKSLAQRILAVEAAVGGDAEGAEAALAKLDEELLGGLEATLEPSRRQAVDAAETAALASLAQRLPADQIEAARLRLRRQLLRNELSLPVLSLFSVSP